MTRTLFFDIETNKINDWATLSDLHTCHCLSIYDPMLPKMLTFHGESIERGLLMLSQAERLVGHNVIDFDIPALKKLYGFSPPLVNVLDTLVLSRCTFPDLRNDDWSRNNFDKELVGSHSLKAWGHRMGSATKLTYGEDDEAFEVYDEEMRKYCERDVVVTQLLYDHLFKQDLTTGFDISTASYSQNFSTATQDSASMGVAFNTDGTKMFVSGQAGGRVNEYALTTGFDVSTASWSTHFIVSSQVSGVAGLAFSTSGKKMFVVSNASDAVFAYDLSAAFSVSTASYNSETINVSSQEYNPNGIAFNNNGSKMFIVGYGGDEINEYNLDLLGLQLGTGSFAAADVGKTIEANSGVFVLTATTGTYVPNHSSYLIYAQVASGSWEMHSVVYNTVDGDLELSSVQTDYFDISTSVYSQSLVVDTQETEPRSIAFNTDGSKMFILGETGDDVNEYTLSVGFDISTASYSQAFSVASQEQYPLGLAFNTDGTKMFVVGRDGDDVNEYALTTGFDVSTASFTDAFSISAQEINPTGVAFSTDGTKMFIVGYGGDDVNEYALSTGFDVSTASFTDAFSVAGQDTTPTGVAFSTNGTKMFIVGDAGNDINQYALTTGFDVSTASFVDSFSVAAIQAQPRGMAFNTDGTKMFVVGRYPTIAVDEYSVGSFLIPTGFNPVHTTLSIDSTYWTDINSMTANQAAGTGNIYYAISTDDRTTWSVIKNGEGERNIVRNNGGTWQYNTAVAVTGGALSQATFDSTGTISQSAFGAFWADSGNLLFIPNQSNDTIYKYTVSSAYDISTASESQSFSVSAKESVPTGIFVRADGLRFYVSGQGSSKVHEYTMSTAYDLSTASFTGSTGTTTSNLTSCWFKEDGLKMYTINYSNSSIKYWTLSTAWDITSASYVSATTLPTKTAGCNDLSFNSAGTQLYVDDNTDDKIYKYTLSTAWDVTSVSYAEDFSHATQLNQVLGMIFNSDLTEMILLVVQIGINIQHLLSRTLQARLGLTRLQTLNLIQ